MQAKPFPPPPSFLSLSSPLLLFALHYHPEVLRVGDRGPYGTNACRTLTSDSWQRVPKAHPHSNTHITPVSFPLSFCFHLSTRFFPSVCFFSFHLSHFALIFLSFRLKLLTQELILSEISEFFSKPGVGSLHWGAEVLWLLQRPWRSNQTGHFGLLMCGGSGYEIMKHVCPSICETSCWCKNLLKV